MSRLEYQGSRPGPIVSIQQNAKKRNRELRDNDGSSLVCCFPLEDHTAKSRQPLTDRTSCLSSVPPLISQSPSQSTAIVSFNDIAPCIEQSEEGEVIRGTVKRLKVGPTSSASVPTRARGYLDLSRDESAHKQRAKVLSNHLTETLAISPRKANEYFT